MLSKFIYNDCYKKVPYTGNVYELDCKGTLRETVSKRLVNVSEDCNGIIRVEEKTGEWFDGLSMAVLLSYVHRNCTVPPRLVKSLDVIYKDGNVKNFGLYNTVWKSPEGKLTHPLYPGFCYIPGFSRYLINQRGEILSPTKGGLLSHYSNNEGYLMYGLQPDVGGRTIVGMHRALALAWISYPANVDKLDVNHLNLDNSDNRLENLEWTTRSRNSLHAHEGGVANSREVMVRDIFNGEVTRYFSVSAAARFLDLNTETVRQRILKGTDGRVYDGLQFKYADDKTPWIEFDDLSDYKWMNRPYTVSVKNTISEKTKTFSRVSEAAAYLDINPATLRSRLSCKNKIVVDEHFVEIRFE